MSRTIHFDRFYGSVDHLLDEFARRARRFPVDASSESAFRKWRGEALGFLWELSGLDRMERCEPETECTEEVEVEGIRRQRILLQTEPGVWMPLYVLIPGDYRAPARLPCVIAAHGHGGIGKYRTVGRTDIPKVREILESRAGKEPRRQGRLWRRVMPARVHSFLPRRPRIRRAEGNSPPRRRGAQCW